MNPHFSQLLTIDYQCKTHPELTLPECPALQNVLILVNYYLSVL